jgi:hypothetical protein
MIFYRCNPMPSKKPSTGRIFLVIASVIMVSIIAEWITIFIYGHVPAGYP